MALRDDPLSILTSDNGTLELAVDGDEATAMIVLKRLTKRFRCSVTRHVRRQFFDREYWFLDVRGYEYMLMRCTPPSTPPGVCLCGPIDSPEALALFRAVADCFGAAEQDRRPGIRRWWRRFWG